MGRDLLGIAAPPPAIAFVGRQNSGKTTLLVGVIAELAAQGLRVGTIKHHSHVGFEIDIEGKDSWRHRQAGSRLTVVSAPDQVAIMQRLEAEQSAEQIIANLTAAGATRDLDIILVEGYRRCALPTIELFRAANPNDAERALGGEGNRIVAVATDMPRIEGEARAANIPVLSIDDPASIARFIIESIPAIL
jgi:molybdopterin-guanine dinucleotide biosynthesis protein MobB